MNHPANQNHPNQQLPFLFAKLFLSIAISIHPLLDYHHQTFSLHDTPYLCFISIYCIPLWLCDRQHVCVCMHIYTYIRTYMYIYMHLIHRATIARLTGYCFNIAIFDIICLIITCQYTYIYIYTLIYKLYLQLNTCSGIFA